MRSLTSLLLVSLLATGCVSDELRTSSVHLQQDLPVYVQHANAMAQHAYLAEEINGDELAAFQAAGAAMVDNANALEEATR